MRSLGAPLLCCCAAEVGEVRLFILNPSSPSYLNSRLLGYVTIGKIEEPRTHYLGNWSPRERFCMTYVYQWV